MSYAEQVMVRFVLVVKVESGTDNAIDGLERQERQERGQRPRGMARSLYNERLGERVTKWQGGTLTFTLIFLKEPHWVDRNRAVH